MTEIAGDDRVHYYQMLASLDEAEDALQETLLRAWRSRESFNGSSLFCESQSAPVSSI